MVEEQKDWKNPTLETEETYVQKIVARLEVVKDYTFYPEECYSHEADKTYRSLLGVPKASAEEQKIILGKYVEHEKSIVSRLVCDYSFGEPMEFASPTEFLLAAEGYRFQTTNAVVPCSIEFELVNQEGRRFYSEGAPLSLPVYDDDVFAYAHRVEAEKQGQEG